MLLTSKDIHGSLRSTGNSLPIKKSNHLSCLSFMARVMSLIFQNSSQLAHLSQMPPVLQMVTNLTVFHTKIVKIQTRLKSRRWMLRKTKEKYSSPWLKRQK